MTEVLFAVAFTWELLLLLAAVLVYILLVGLALWWLAAKRPENWLSRLWAGQSPPMRLMLVAFAAIWGAFFLFAVVKGFTILTPSLSPPQHFLSVLTASRGAENIGTGALVVAVLGSPLVIWATMLKHRTVAFQKEGHMTDRISKAVEQLGAEKTVKAGADESGKPIERTEPNIEVRIGGLLSLERIAEDSMNWDKGRDHIRIMQIICAYLRQNSPAKSVEATQTPFRTRTPRLDLQFAADVLCRRTPEQVGLEAEQKFRLDLRDVDFDGMFLTGGNFSGALMMRSRFEATDFYRTDLTGARLHGSLLNFANLSDTVMRGTRLDMAIYSQGNMQGFFRVVAPSITIQGAEMTALRITAKNAEGFFGSSDTKLNPQDDAEHLAPALRVADLRHLHKGRNPTEGDGSEYFTTIPKAWERFLHWNPFTANDMAYSEFLTPWQKRHNLTGWPFED